MSVQSLVHEGLLERVPEDGQSAVSLLADSRRHLRSAESLIGTDRNGSYQLAYDAARKALAAHMSANGYRVRGRVVGAHAIVARYAEAVLTIPEARHFDRMRRNRHRSEYGGASIGVKADLANANAIVAAVEKDLA